MSESKKKYLLPSGFKDYLDDDAEREFAAMVSLLSDFSEAGYKKVSPPVLEFDSSNEEGNQNFKFIDPVSQQTVSLRSDITPQICRIVSSRLTSEKPPFRICYYGDIYQINPLNIQGDRQMKQVGVELVSDKLDAADDVEVLRLAVESLTKLGLKNLTIDLNTPKLVECLDEDYDADVLRALEKKELAKLPPRLRKLTELCGEADSALAVLDEDLPAEAMAQLRYVEAVCLGLKKLSLPTNITIDFVENRSNGYQEKLSFSIFSSNVRGNVGRGGRYKTKDSDDALHATGFSLYLNNFINALDK